MSDEAKPAESAEDALLGLTSLDFGPAWARGGAEKKKEGTQEGKGKPRRDDRGEGRRDDRGGERRDDRRGGRRDDKRGGRDDRREGRGGGGRRQDNRGGGDRGNRYEKGGRGRRDDDRGRPVREETPAPEGYTAQVMPVEDGLDGLAKEILAGGRTYSVFDLAKLVLGARERFNVNFRSGGEKGLIRCKADGSLWLTKEEAVSHFLRADWRKDYYEEVVSEAKPPQGNFQTVARCGMSNEWLGPPNYHGYQPAVMQMHRERFAHMSLEAYKRKIRMERGEEAVNAWLDKMSKRVAYRPTGGVKREKPAEAGAAKTESPAAEAGAGAETEGQEAAPVEEGGSEVEAVEASGEGSGADAPDVEAAPETSAESESEEDVAEADVPEEDASEEAGNEAEDVDEETSDDSAPAAGPALEEMRDVERHFLEHHFEDAFLVTNRAWVSGAIAGNLLSPGLLTLLRDTVAEERRYPGKLTPMLCRQLSGRHVAVFKWRRKLKAGPSRPHPVPEDITIADRPMSLLTWITENSGQKLGNLWKALLPADVSDQEKLGWYHDLHWLLNQGYALLMADSTVHRAKKPGEDDSQGAKKKTKAKKGKPREGRDSPGKGKGKGTAPAPPPPAPVPEPAPPVPEPALPAPEPALPDPGPSVVPARTRSCGSPGLYALGGCTLSGVPKSPESFLGRGLWPLPSRIESEEEDGEEGDEEDEDSRF